jgi:ribosome biogenesis ATPase
MSGESEGRIRDLFKVASDSAPALIFLDEIDAIAPKRGDGGGSGGNRGMEKRMVAQLLTCLDMLAPQNNRDGAPVLVLAATNRPDSLDAALRRAGRFDKEIFLGVPDEDAREHILRTMTSSIRLAGNFDYKLLARKTPGFVGADVQSLAKEAAILAINRICRDVLDGGAAALSEPLGSSMSSGLRLRSLAPLSPEQMDDLYVTMDDFLAAVPLVQPSSKREGFATVPDVTWQDIGALQSIRDELTISVLEPIRCPEKFRALGLSLPAGVLLYGTCASSVSFGSCQKL